MRVTVKPLLDRVGAKPGAVKPELFFEVRAIIEALCGLRVDGRMPPEYVRASEELRSLLPIEDCQPDTYQGLITMLYSECFAEKAVPEGSPVFFGKLLNILQSMLSDDDVLDQKLTLSIEKLLSRQAVRCT